MDRIGYAIKRSSIYIDNALFTKHDVPLQINDDERLFYISSGVNLYLQIGNGIPSETRIYRGVEGTVYLTSFRFIYKCHTGNFNSISLPYKVIQEITDDYEIVFLEDNLSMNIILSFNGVHKKVFLAEFKRIYQTIEKKEVELPYYSDLV
ncbi:hypothetical protein TUBRATIS_15780 [Tubulinosema ratisbonensis]|uniref:GRAM domain-containing protein n=1 Tax=Tubulinosema ratisbonensis TaxID=291195 RepID=A0A437ALJ9_9MICR|nr:hypothetical protein TUBRATIS_15780 [Tubulinosema ratisbonensis]